MSEAVNTANQIGPVSRQDPRVKRLVATMNIHKRRPEALIEVLHTAQDSFGYLPLNVIGFVANEMNPPSRVYGVATFYHFFSLKPKGEHTCLVCTGTACYVKGADRLLDELEKSFGLKPGEISSDGKLSVQTARCLGACGLAPAVVLDNDILAKAEPAKMVETIRERTVHP